MICEVIVEAAREIQKLVEETVERKLAEILPIGLKFPLPLIDQLVLQKKKGMQLPPIIECTYLVGLCFALSITFAVISVNPIKPMMPLRPRYLVPFLPFASIMTVYVWSVLVAKVPVENRSGKELLASLILVSQSKLLEAHVTAVPHDEHLGDRPLANHGPARVARAADVPGFIVNHVARPYYLEAFRILEDGHATAAADCNHGSAVRHLVER